MTATMKDHIGVTTTTMVNHTAFLSITVFIFFSFVRKRYQSKGRGEGGKRARARERIACKVFWIYAIYGPCCNDRKRQ